MPYTQPYQIANQQIEPPTVGHNGYQGFNPRTEILPAGWNGFNSRALSEDMVVEHDVGVKVRDGCTLYCDIYRPTHSDKVPAIVCWSPFGKKHNGIRMMKKIPWGVGVPDGCLSGLERFEGPDPAEYVLRGFAVVNVDARGAGDSDGSIVIMGSQEGEDGHDVIEELAQMDWCNGSIGLAGNSHLGIVQWFIAAQQPPSLKAIAPWEACGDLYREQFVRGGAWDNGLFDLIIQQSIRGRHGLEDFREMYRRRSNTINPYWADKRADIKRITIPTYVVASYSTFVHTMGSIRGWLEVNTLDKWLRWDPYQEWYDLWAVPESREELAQFFGKYLKGEDNGWEKTPKVRSCLLKFSDSEPTYPIVEDDYPIPRTEYRTFYFSDGFLTQTCPDGNGAATYDSESTTRPVDFAGFTLKFDQKTHLVGLPKAIIHVSCDDLDDMVIYVLIRKLDKNGNEMYNLNILSSSRKQSAQCDSILYGLCSTLALMR